MMRGWLAKPIHESWLVAAYSLGVVIGVVAVMGAPYGFFSSWMWLVSGLGLGALTVWKRQRWLVVVVIIAGVLVGLWRGSVGQVGLEHFADLYGRQVVVSGRVLEDPDIDKRGQTVLRLGDVVINEQELPGNLWVVTERNDVIRRSDEVTAGGTLGEGFGAFVGSMYRANIVRVERVVPGDVAVTVRDWFAGRVRQYVPEPESALGLGFLLGLRRALPSELAEALKIAGLTHVIVASGYNLTILVRLARRLFARVSKYVSMLSASAMILGFMALTGLSPSMTRAGLVAGLSLAAWYYGRKIHPLVLLPFAAAVTLLINPQYGWNDLGWQLSFASFAGVILLAPLLQRYFFGEKEPGTVRQIFGETLSAQIMTFPLLVMVFGVISNVSLIANVLILPFVPVAMLLTFLSGVFASLPLIGALIALPTTWLLSYMVAVADWLAGRSWAQTEVSLSGVMVVIVYVLIFLAMFYMQRKTKLQLRDVNIVR